MWSAGTNWVVFPTAFQGATLPTATPSASSPHHPPSHTTTLDAMAWLAQIDTWYATQYVGGDPGSGSTVDFDGNTLLDNTVVVYLSEIGRAYDHDQRNVPFLVFGGKNTRIKGGQYLKITDGPLSGLENVTREPPLERPVAGAGPDLWGQPAVTGQPDAVDRAAAGPGDLGPIAAARSPQDFFPAKFCRRFRRACPSMATWVLHLHE